MLSKWPDMRRTECFRLSVHLSLTWSAKRPGFHCQRKCNAERNDHNEQRDGPRNLHARTVDRDDVFVCPLDFEVHVVGKRPIEKSICPGNRSRNTKFSTPPVIARVKCLLCPWQRSHRVPYVVPGDMVCFREISNHPFLEKSFQKTQK